MLLSTVASSLTTFASESPKERKVGVKVGDWALYGNINVTWSSNDPNARPEPSLVLANNTEWFKNVVTEIAGTIIGFQNITHFRDDTETANHASIDVDLGYGNGTFMFVSAGLSRDDSVYEVPEEPLFINETLSRTYAGVSREVNHLNLTPSLRWDTDPPQIIQVSLDYYWDRITGILTERQGSFVNQTGNYLTSSYRSDMIVETNLWSSDKPPPASDGGEGFPFWLLGVAMIVVLGVLLLYSRRGKSRLKVRKHRKKIPK